MPDDTVLFLMLFSIGMLIFTFFPRVAIVFSNQSPIERSMDKFWMKRTSIDQQLFVTRVGCGTFFFGALLALGHIRYPTLVPDFSLLQLAVIGTVGALPLALAGTFQFESIGEAALQYGDSLSEQLQLLVAGLRTTDRPFPDEVLPAEPQQYLDTTATRPYIIDDITDDRGSYWADVAKATYNRPEPDHVPTEPVTITNEGIRVRCLTTDTLNRLEVVEFIADVELTVVSSEENGNGPPHHVDQETAAGSVPPRQTSETETDQAETSRQETRPLQGGELTPDGREALAELCYETIAAVLTKPIPDRVYSRDEPYVNRDITNAVHTVELQRSQETVKTVTIKNLRPSVKENFTPGSVGTSTPAIKYLSEATFFPALESERVRPGNA